MKLNKYLFTHFFFITVCIFMFEHLYAQDYYPLQVSNRWDFIETNLDPITLITDTSYSSFKVIGDSVFPNGKSYFVMDNYDLAGGKYIRADGGNIFYYDEYENEEDTLFKTKAEVGDQWELQFNATLHVSVESIDTINIFSYLSRVMTFRLDGLFLFYVAVSDIFGPIYFYSSGEPPGTYYTDKSLLGCVINGIRYGNLVSVAPLPSAIEGFSLAQNYPNPFNPSTKIKYRIPFVRTRDRVSLQIIVYDVLGNEITRLVNEEKPAGTYEIEFDALGLPSGVYFYQLKTYSFIQTKKMLLLK